jgi:hypothetical protein
MQNAEPSDGLGAANDRAVLPVLSVLGASPPRNETRRLDR